MDIKEMYDKNVNIQEYFRELTGKQENDVNAILYSYDYQAGTYTQQYFDAAIVKDLYVHNGEKQSMTKRHSRELLGKYVAEELYKLKPTSLLEVGTGEATGLCDIILNSSEKIQFSGIDLSLSRLMYAQKFAKYKKVDVTFAMGDMFSLPYLDNSFDVILLMHCLESNMGREEKALKELLRVAKKYIVLLEPSYELGNAETRKRIKDLCYIDNLNPTIEKLNLNVIKNELFKITTYNNNTAITIIEKQEQDQKDNEKSDRANTDSVFACPNCKTGLHKHEEAYFCPKCFNLYPIIQDIPILNAAHAILCSKYETDINILEMIK